ncbi:MAG: hypothetical protein K2Q25_04710 [Mycobacteriaceae bacterium]|nr:hypothetical protein [Mycobacteriaceae bacterium]
MNNIDQWFERTARRQERAVSLYTSLLTDRIFAYFRYRLRLTLALATARFVLRAAEFLIVFSRFGEAAAHTVMILRIGSFIVNGGWWGLLEIMRERIREFSRSDKREAVEREIGRWLVLAIVTALSLLMIGCVALARLLPSDDDPLGRSYAYLVIIELALGLPVRVLHSGMFATRRIYRPVWSIFAPTIVQLAVMSMGIIFYPAAAIIAAIIMANTINIWITVHYTLQAYQLTGMRPRHQAQYRSLRELFPSIPVRLGIQTTLGGLALRLDGMIVFAIFGIHEFSSQSSERLPIFSAWQDINIFQFFYLILPLLRGASQSVGVFYFDFVRLHRIPALHQFQLKFFHKILWITPAIALFFWALSICLGFLIMPDIPFSFLAIFLSVFLMRSVISAYQIRMFAEGRFLALNTTIMLLFALLWLVWLDGNPASDIIQILAAVITLLIVYINLQHCRDRMTPPLPTLLSLRDWIHTLAQDPEPVLIGRITIPDWIPARQKAATVKIMQQFFNGKGHFAFRSPTAIFFYQRTGQETAEQQPHLALQTSTGGAATRGECLHIAPTPGYAALRHIITEKWLLPSDSGLTAPQNPVDLRAEFLKIFPTGIAADLKTGAGAADIRKLEQNVLAGIWPSATKSLAEGTLILFTSGRWLSAIFDQGQLRLLCILPTEFDASLVKNWVLLVQEWQLDRRTVEGLRYACRY